jgi:L-threonylcarbamoyladenylate synthase
MEAEIQKALQVLRGGGTILCPTDTVWGISCDATNKDAVEKIFKIKERDPSKSMIVLVDDEKFLNKYLKEVPELAWDLVEMAERPLTIIYDDARGLAANVIGPDGSIAIRVCKDEFCKKLIHKFGRPIVSTSANKSGDPAPLHFAEIEGAILAGVDYVVNWRQDEHQDSSPSSIIKLKMNGQVQVIRK